MAKILVVDDEVEICELIKHEFEKHGHDIEVAHSGEEGLEKLRENYYDALILDLVMPGIGGEGVLSHRDEFAGTAVIILTAHSSTATAVHALRHKANDYLEKPIELKRLVEIVESYIDRFSYGDFTIETSRKMAYYKGEPIPNMTTGLFDIFSIFVRFPDEWFDYTELLKRLFRLYPSYAQDHPDIAKQLRSVEGIEKSRATGFLRAQMSRLRNQVLAPLVDGKEVLTSKTGRVFGWHRDFVER